MCSASAAVVAYKRAPADVYMLTKHQRHCYQHNTLLSQTRNDVCVAAAVGMLFSLMTPLISQDTNTSPCFKEVPNLAPCASDGSLQIKEGCCSQDCADRMKQVGRWALFRHCWAITLSLGIPQPGCQSGLGKWCHMSNSECRMHPLAV